MGILLGVWMAGKVHPGEAAGGLFPRVQVGLQQEVGEHRHHCGSVRLFPDALVLPSLPAACLFC